MERSTLFWIGRINIVKVTLLPKIQYHPYQISNGIFHRPRKKMFTVCMETENPDSQSNLEKEKWGWKNQAP